MLKIGILLENRMINTFRIKRLIIQKLCAEFDDAKRIQNFHLRMKELRRMEDLR